MNNKIVLDKIQKIQINHEDFITNIHPTSDLLIPIPTNLVSVKNIVNNPAPFINKEIAISGLLEGQIFQDTTWIIYPNRAHMEFSEHPIRLCLKDTRFSHILSRYFDAADHVDSVFIAEVYAIGELCTINNRCEIMLTELKSIQLKKRGNLYTIKL